VKRFVAILCTCLILLITMESGWSVSAQISEESFRFVMSTEEAYENDEVRISILANDVQMKENIAGFRLAIQFDSTKLTFKRADTSSQIQNGTFRYHVEGDDMTGIYVCNGISAPKLTGECITVVFQVNDGSVLGETSLSAQIDQMVDWNAEQMPSVSSVTSVVTLLPQFTQEAILTTLIPDHGELDPAFDPYIQEYTLNVNPEVTQVLFELKAADGGTARVNRKNLGARGSMTQFVVTVTSEDKKSKSQYVINVNRGKVIETNGTSSGKSSTTRNSGNSGSTRKSGEVSQIDGVLDTGAETIFYGDRNLYVIGSQMSAYVTYIILGGTIGILLICMVVIAVIARKKRK